VSLELSLLVGLNIYTSVVSQQAIPKVIDKARP
jgi:hypothetical protein